jgi:menaquinol-cytochrome c reductase iron-sulfur subunit
MQPEELSRRRFFARLSIGLSSATAFLMSLPLVGFIIAPLFRKSPAIWCAVGKTETFQIGSTVAVSFDDPSPLPWAGVTARTAAWLRRVDDEHYIAFVINCTHLGCPVRWLPTSNLFMCPCHGGVYYQDGTVAAGPPPLPLPRYEVRVREGVVEIKTEPLPISRFT